MWKSKFIKKSPFKNDPSLVKGASESNKQVAPKNPSEDPDWMRREVNRHQQLNLDYDHLKKYMTEEEKKKYTK